MVEVALDGLAKHIEEGTIQAWLVEEGDPITKGDDLLEVSTEDGVVTITAPATGILAEVYYDEGEIVGRGEVLCMVDTEDQVSEDDDKDDEDEDSEEEDEDADDEDLENKDEDEEDEDEEDEEE